MRIAMGIHSLSFRTPVYRKLALGFRVHVPTKSYFDMIQWAFTTTAQKQDLLFVSPSKDCVVRGSKATPPKPDAYSLTWRFRVVIN